MIYTSNRSFRFWAYTVSHNVLLLRSSLTFEDVDGYDPSMKYNIDIEFNGVGYIDIPDTIDGIELEEIAKELPKKFQRYSKSMGYKVFEIKSDGKLYYIIAAGYMIGKNAWIEQNRILNPDLRHDEILAMSSCE